MGVAKFLMCHAGIKLAAVGVSIGTLTDVLHLRGWTGVGGLRR